MKLLHWSPGVGSRTVKLSVLFFLGLALCGTSAGQTLSAPQAAEIEQLTSALIDPAQAGTSPAEVRARAQKRHDLLLKLIETAPAEAFRFILPAEVAANLPGNARELVESDADEQGILEVLVEDYPDHSHRILFFLDTDRERLQLYFAKDKPNHLLTGSRVRARGKRLDGVMLLQSGSNPADASSGLETQALASPNTFGAQSTVVILVNFQDNTAQPHTLATARTLVFTDVSNFDMENSQNQTWLTGDVFGWFTLAMNVSTCDSNQLATLANQAATAAGVNLSGYRRFVYSFPKNGCSWAGLGSVGGNPSRAWINGSFNLLVVGHEMGHNFGLYHAHSLICPGTTLGTNCSTGEYGDVFDIMGNYTASHFDAFHKEQIGWLSYGSSLPITTVTSSGTYTIPPYETGSGSKALKIPKSTGPNTWYYVEYRQPIGFDSVLSSYPLSTSGVLVRTAADGDPNSSFLLDMRPQTSTFGDASLAVGQTFIDSAGGVTITLQSANSSGATVDVTLGPTSCPHSNPGVAITPAQATGGAGGTVTYTVSVTNNDNASCATSNFLLAASVPAGWSTAFASQSLVLAPGVTGSTTVNVTSSASAASGVNSVVVSATNAAATSFTGSATAAYTVSTPPVTMGLRFFPLAPCRIADTRNANGPFGGPFIAAQSSRSFVVPNSACGVPSTAAAYSLNLTAVPKTFLGYLTVWPTGQTRPVVSTLNSTDGRVKANAAIVPAGTGGAISVFVTDAADVVLDINGYFVDAANPSALAFFPLTPCRIADTRDSSGPLGGPALVGAQERSFPVRSSNCTIPASAVAYSLNFTAVAPHGLGFLSAWPTGMTRPLVSTLNAPTGQGTANAGIVPAGTNGAISVYASSEADVIIDVNGYFAVPTSAPNPLSFYALNPCRVLDTRNTTGLLSDGLIANMTSGPCGILTSVRAVVLNATVLPAHSLSFLCLWPGGQNQPWVSTLNANDALVTSNMAVVPTTNGFINAYVTDPTQLVLDTTGYFAP